MLFESDVLLIGAGVTGCATARALSRYACSVIVVDRGSDVADGATKANSGIIHAGYDAVPGTRKAFYNVRGANLYPEICKELSVPYSRNGALVIGFNEEDRKTLQKLKDRGLQNGVPDLRIVEKDELLAIEPSLNPNVLYALLVPGSAIVSPYEIAFAMADDAAMNGVHFRFNEEVLQILRLPEGMFRVNTRDNEYLCRTVINCAGSSSATFHHQMTGEHLDMTHRRGQYYLLDRAVKPPFRMTVFQCPSVMGKGVLVTPTVHGNTLLGPNAEDIPDPLDTATTQTGLDDVLMKAARTWPQVSVRSNITNFSGVRAHLSTDDFLVGPVTNCPGAFEAVGIESPGLSSAPAIGEDLCRWTVASLGTHMKENTVKYSPPKKPFRAMTEEEQQEAVQKNPAYGNIICRCEVVTEAEIRDAIRRPVGARTVDGVKRRVRAGMGRCQGGFCLPRVMAILSEEVEVDMLAVTKNGRGSYLLNDTVSNFLKGGEDHA